MRTLQEFIWDGKRPRIAYKTLILPIARGGLKLMDLDIRIQSNYLQWVRRVLRNPLSNTAAFLCKLTGYSSLVDYFAAKWEDNPEWTTKHKFYARMHQIWNKFHCFQPTDEQGVRDEILWHNRWITSGGSPLLFPGCQRAGIRTISDICHENEARTLSHQELNTKYGIRISFLDMMRIRQSIPLHWRQKISQNWTPPLPGNPVIKVRFAPTETRDILSLSAKAAYSLILEGMDHEPTALSTWQRGVEEVTILDKDTWAHACTEVYKNTRETKLQSFHYKVLHRVIPCNRYLTQIRIKDTDWCPFCDESDTIPLSFHLRQGSPFLECRLLMVSPRRQPLPRRNHH